MRLTDIATYPEPQALKQISRYVQTTDLQAIDQDLANLKPDSLSVMLNICLIRALNSVKNNLSNWTRYYIALRNYLTQKGYDAPFILRGL